jgi:hypothetical protein
VDQLMKSLLLKNIFVLLPSNPFWFIHGYSCRPGKSQGKNPGLFLLKQGVLFQHTELLISQFNGDIFFIS